jgi:murein DD-endopeptidase MepM/ murein hydrolase activator NlpD
MAFKMTAFDGWLASTVLLWLFNRNDDSSSDTDTQKADLLNENNTTKIGSAIPACIGRCMVKEPLVSYFGDFRADIYTEEYGMHTGIDWRNIIPMIVLGIIAIVSTEDGVVTNTGGGTTVGAGARRAVILLRFYYGF